MYVAVELGKGGLSVVLCFGRADDTRRLFTGKHLRVTVLEGRLVRSNKYMRSRDRRRE